HRSGEQVVGNVRQPDGTLGSREIRSADSYESVRGDAARDLRCVRNPACRHDGIRLDAAQNPVLLTPWAGGEVQSVSGAAAGAITEIQGPQARKRDVRAVRILQGSHESAGGRVVR